MSRGREHTTLSGGVASRADVVPVVLVTIAGAALRAAGLGSKSLWTDELYVVWEGRQPLSLIFDPQIHVQHPPGYRLALHIWMGLGLSETWIRLLPALCGAALVPVVWAIARSLWPGSRAAAGLASLLAATSPFLIHYSQDATAYSWSTLWVSISVLLLVRAWRANGAALWIAWGVSLAICLYSHYFTFFPLAVEGIAALGVGLAGGSERRGLLRRAALAILGATALYLPWLWAVYTASRVTPFAYLFPLTVDTQPLRWLPVLLFGYPHEGFWANSVVVAALWAALILAAGLVVWKLARRSESRLASSLALVAAWAAAATAGPYLFLRVTTPASATDPVRFAAMSAPALLLGAARLLAALPSPARMLLAACWVGVAGAQYVTEYTQTAQQDWRAALGLVSAGAKSGDAFLAFPAFHAGAAAAYYREPLDVQGGWFTGEGADPTGAAYWFPPAWRWRGFLETTAYRSAGWPTELRARTGGAKRVWYLAGDGVDGTYPPGRAAEAALSSLGWRPQQEWHNGVLVLKLYTRPTGALK